MPDPTLLTGAGIGGVVVATCWGISKVIPAIAKAVKSNSGSKSTAKLLECKPGKADVCIKRGEKLATHNQILINLVNATEESKADRKDIKDKLDSGFQRVYDKLDKMK